MTPEAERKAQQDIAKATRAQAAYDEFIQPVIGEIKATYSARIVELANTELSRDRRADKLTALSNAIRIAGQVEAGVLEAIRSGDLARAELLKAEKIENMTAPKRRLLGIAPGY